MYDDDDHISIYMGVCMYVKRDNSMVIAYNV